MAKQLHYVITNSTGSIEVPEAIGNALGQTVRKHMTFVGYAGGTTYKYEGERYQFTPIYREANNG